jgi:hypothetical protein
MKILATAVVALLDVGACASPAPTAPGVAPTAVLLQSANGVAGRAQ